MAASLGATLGTVSPVVAAERGIPTLGFSRTRAASWDPSSRPCDGDPVSGSVTATSKSAKTRLDARLKESRECGGSATDVQAPLRLARVSKAVPVSSGPGASTAARPAPTGSGAKRASIAGGARRPSPEDVFCGTGPKASRAVAGRTAPPCRPAPAGAARRRPAACRASRTPSQPTSPGRATAKPAWSRLDSQISDPRRRQATTETASFTLGPIC